MSPSLQNPPLRNTSSSERASLVSWNAQRTEAFREQHKTTRQRLRSSRGPQELLPWRLPLPLHRSPAPRAPGLFAQGEGTSGRCHELPDKQTGPALEILPGDTAHGPAAGKPPRA